MGKYKNEANINRRASFMSLYKYKRMAGTAISTPANNSPSIGHIPIMFSQYGAKPTGIKLREYSKI